MIVNDRCSIKEVEVFSEWSEVSKVERDGR